MTKVCKTTAKFAKHNFLNLERLVLQVLHRAESKNDKPLSEKIIPDQNCFVYDYTETPIITLKRAS